MDNNELWQSVLAQMQLHISKANFATWFQNTEIILKDNEKILISVPNAFSKEWLSNKYYKLMLKTMHEIDNTIKELEFTINPQSSKKFIANKYPTYIQEFDFNNEGYINLIKKYFFYFIAQILSWIFGSS